MTPTDGAAGLLAQLWKSPSARSRNRNYFRFRDDWVYRRAVLRVRALATLRRDLLRYGGSGRAVVSWLDGCERALLTLRVPWLRLVRTVRLSRAEVSLLLDEPAVAAQVDLDPATVASRDRTA